MIGGLTSDRAIKLVRGLKDLNIVGMDVVEVAPAYDQSGDHRAGGGYAGTGNAVYPGGEERRITGFGLFCRMSLTLVRPTLLLNL